MAIAANKVKGIRAASVSEPVSAALARSHNDANIVCLGARIVGPEVAIEVVRTFLATPFSGAERHARRVEQIGRLDERRDCVSAEPTGDE
jgi:ribose 5-phosphate isomerase B